MSNHDTRGWLRYLGLGVYAGLVAIAIGIGLIKDAITFGVAVAPIVTFIGADQIKHRNE